MTIVITLLFLIIELSSCRSTKNVPKDKYLLSKVSINKEDKEINKNDIYKILRQEPNRKVLFVYKFHLGVYNLFKNDKNRKFFNKIADVVGEAPVIYEEYESKKTVNNITQFLQSKGYYESSVYYSEEFNDKKRKVSLVYNIDIGSAYKISKITYHIEDSLVNNYIINDSSNSLLKVGNNFDMSILEDERERLLRFLKTKGYFYFNIKNIHYFADTAFNSHQAELTISIENHQLKKDEIAENEENDTNINFVRQKINNIYIFPNYSRYRRNRNNPTADIEQKIDTVIFDNYHIIYNNSHNLKASTLLQSCFLIPGETYDINNVEKTQKRLASLKVFKNINISFTKPTSGADSARNDILDAHLLLMPHSRQSYSLEAEAYTTSGNYGMSGAITYNNKNLFRGAQNFYIKASLAFQTLETLVEEEKEILFNTFETGFESKLKFPKLLIPFWDNYKFTKEHNPFTQIGLSFSYQKRPEYTRTISSATFSYLWKSSKSKYISHFISPLEIYSVKIYNFDSAFRDRLSNSFLRYSYENQLITVINYDFQFSNRDINTLNSFTIFDIKVETSGNLLYSIYKIFDIPKKEDSYRIFDLAFSQYIKFDGNYIYHQRINSRHELVYRAYAGVGISYGNSKGLPFVKKYFIGGANDLRGWTVRTIGPGGYNNSESRVEQIGDMKIVLNFEYRYNIFTFSNGSQLNGALFFDSGNVWSLDKNDTRTNTKFKFNEFYKQMALNSGIGLRYDMSFFVIRLDVGVPFYSPRGTEGWVIKNLKFKNVAWNFGINYPF